MTLKQLRYMLAVAQYKSINEAAKKCFISQPSLSNAIKDLEEEIGLELFIRTAKGITLTAEGSEFLKYAQQVYSQIKRIRNVIIVNGTCSMRQAYAKAVLQVVTFLRVSVMANYVV